MKKVLSIFVLFAICLFVFPKYSHASSIILSSSQASIIGPNEEFVADVNLSVSTSNGTIYYLRGEFYQQNTSNYCGFTWNGTGWYNGPYTTNNGWINLLSVPIQSNSWTGQIKAKIDLGDQGCTASGNYNFRVQRYTSSGFVSSDTETPLSVAVSIPTSSPTSSPTPIPSASPSLSPTQTTFKAVYTINKPKDDAGSELTSVQIYVDEQYIHHVDDEILEFYPANECYLGVSCGFGNHIISLRKNGYSNWEDMRDFLAGINLEVNPVLNRQNTASPTPTPTKTPTPVPTPTKMPTPTPVKTSTSIPTSSPKGIVLGEEAVFPSPQTSDIVKNIENSKEKIPLIAVVLVVSGTGLIGFSVFTIIRNAKKSYTVESEKESNQIS